MPVRWAPTWFGRSQENLRYDRLTSIRRWELVVQLDDTQATWKLYFDLDLWFSVYHSFADEQAWKDERFMYWNTEISKEECMRMLQESKKYKWVEL